MCLVPEEVPLDSIPLDKLRMVLCCSQFPMAMGCMLRVNSKAGPQNGLMTELVGHNMGGFIWAVSSPPPGPSMYNQYVLSVYIYIVCFYV